MHRSKIFKEVYLIYPSSSYPSRQIEKGLLYSPKITGYIPQSLSPDYRWKWIGKSEQCHMGCLCFVYELDYVWGHPLGYCWKWQPVVSPLPSPVAEVIARNIGHLMWLSFARFPSSVHWITFSLKEIHLHISSYTRMIWLPMLFQPPPPKKGLPKVPEGLKNIVVVEGVTDDDDGGRSQNF